MKHRSHARARDLNEPEIVEALRRLGATVILLDQPVDLLVGFRGRTYLLEVKRGDLLPAHRPLTDAETLFFQTWRGERPAVIRCLDEALCVLGIARHPGKSHDGHCDCGGVEDPYWLIELRQQRKAASGSKRAVRRIPSVGLP